MASCIVPGADGCVTFKAAATVTNAMVGHAMKLTTTAWTVNVADADGDLVVGVLMNKTSSTAGDDARVFTLAGGIVPVMIGAAVTSIGQQLTCDASGHFIMCTDGDICLAIALETGTTDGQMIMALWTSPFHVADESFYRQGS